MKNLNLKIFLLFIAIVLTNNAAARIKCWTNNEGNRECGDKIPPEYTQQGYKELDKSGLVREEKEKVKTAKTNPGMFALIPLLALAGGGGGGRGSGQITDIPKLIKRTNPDINCNSIASAKYKFKAAKKETRMKVCLSILILNTFFLFLWPNYH